MKNKIIAGASWSAVEAFSGQVISFVVFLILARLLAPADFGLIALANIYVLIVQYLIFQGLGQAIIQFEDLDDEHLNTVFWINLAAAFGFVFLTWVSSDSIARWFSTPTLAAILKSLSPIFLLAALTDVQNNLLTRHLQFKSLALRTLVSYALGGVAGITLAWLGYGVWSFVAQQLTVWLINFISLWTSSTWRPRWVFSTTKAKRLLTFGVNLLAVDLMNLASKRSDQSVVGRSLGPPALGFYAVGARVSSLVSEILVKSLSRVTLSGLSRLQNEIERFLNALYRIFELQIVIALPAASGLALLASPVVQMCFGAKWQPGVAIMQVLLLAIPFEALSAVHFSALVALGRPRSCSILMTLHAMVNILFCVLVARHGVLAIAGAVALRALILYPVEVWVVKQIIPLSIARILQSLAPILLATAAMVFITHTILRITPVADIAQLIVGITVGAVTYTGTLALVRPRLIRELWQIKKILGNKTLSA